MNVKPGEGLYYRNDDDLMDEIFDGDYNKKYFLSIPGEEGVAYGSHTRVLGGPQPNPNATSAKLVCYRAERKKFTEKIVVNYLHLCERVRRRFCPISLRRLQQLRIPGISLSISV